MKRVKAVGIYCLWAMLAFAARGEQTAGSVTQYGITWTFDKEYPVGQFVNGDYWVVGPVNIVSVTPEPGPAKETSDVSQKSRYGATALVSDSRMRNGSMIIEGPDYSADDKTGFEKQGYDSRVINYAAERSVRFPCTLDVNRSLISTVSSEKMADGKLSTPDVLGESKIFLCKPSAPLVLESAAVLTCLDSVPPPDAFRPPYAGKEKPIYRAGDIRWEMLPDLKKLSSSPDWKVMARIFERPWLDHIGSWLIQNTLPGQNGPQYGREFSRMTSLAALMLLQDVPMEEKKPLMIGYLQLGIDLSGLAHNGRQWFSDGGHWQGRKWPILFASLMLNDEALRTFPPVDLSRPVYAMVRVAPGGAVEKPTTFFQEDLDYYYGQGGDGQTALWQIIMHTGPQPPYQETPRAELTQAQQFCDNYHHNNVGTQSGAALAAMLMGAREIWNKEAFFDHIDWWMTTAVWPQRPAWLPAGAGKTFDTFMADMWKEYRDDVPDQPKGKDNFKWVWKEGATGYWENNPKVTDDISR